MSDLNAIRKAVSSIPISNAKRNIIIKAFSEGGGVSPEEFASVKNDVKTLVDTALTKSNLGKANGVASLDSSGNVPISQLKNVDTNLFYVAAELPTTDIKTNKIYLVPSTNTGDKNIYTEYAYINDAWEKIGEFQATPDLSQYARLRQPTFRGIVTFENPGSSYRHNLYGNVYVESPLVRGTILSANSPNDHTAFGTASTFLDVGLTEDFTFTLEDGSTITKTIRVIS